MIKISVIIPVYNEEKYIEECLISLSKQINVHFEVIVVDDSSKDNTSVVVRDVIKNSKDLNIQYPIKFLTTKHLGPGNARNIGVTNSVGDILVFVDADMTFDDEFLSKLTLPIIKNQSKGTFSSKEYVLNWANIWARCLNLEKGWIKERRHPENYPSRQEVFRAIAKSEFSRVGGFSTGGYDDDWSLYKKLGYKADDVSDALFYHKNPSDLIEVFNQAKWASKRNYKAGFIGILVAFLRVSLPLSLAVGVYKSVRYLNPAFLVFKIIYDLGSFLGILEMIIFGKYAE